MKKNELKPESIIEESNNKFLIKWQGLDNNKNTWLKRYKIKDFDKLYKQFKEKNQFIINLNFDYQKYIKRNYIIDLQELQEEIDQKDYQKDKIDYKLKNVQKQKEIKKTNTNEIYEKKIVEENNTLIEQKQAQNLNDYIEQQMKFFEQIRLNIKNEQFQKNDIVLNYETKQKVQKYQSINFRQIDDELLNTPYISDDSVEQIEPNKFVEQSQIKIINPFKPNEEPKEQKNQNDTYQINLQKYKEIQHVFELIPYKFKIKRLRKLIEFVPKFTHILLVVDDRGYEFIKKKIDLQYLKTNLVIEKIENMEKYNPNGEYLICANDSQLKIRKYKMYLDTVYHIIHFDAPENQEKYFQRLKLVQGLKQSIIFLTENEESKSKIFIQLLLDMNQKIPQQMIQIHEAERNEQLKQQIVEKSFKQIIDSNFELEFNHKKNMQKIENIYQKNYF